MQSVPAVKRVSLYGFLNQTPVLSAGAMAVRCSPSTAQDSNAKIATTLTSVKTASRHANTTLDIPLAESTSPVRRTFAMTTSVVLLWDCEHACKPAVYFLFH